MRLRRAGPTTLSRISRRLLAPPYRDIIRPSDPAWCTIPPHTRDPALKARVIGFPFEFLSRRSCAHRGRQP